MAIAFQVFEVPELDEPELEDPELEDPELEDPELEDPELEDEPLDALSLFAVDSDGLLFEALAPSPLPDLGFGDDE